MLPDDLIIDISPGAEFRSSSATVNHTLYKCTFYVEVVLYRFAKIEDILKKDIAAC